jgi:hypothetical protein
MAAAISNILAFYRRSWRSSAATEWRNNLFTTDGTDEHGWEGKQKDSTAERVESEGVLFTEEHEGNEGDRMDGSHSGPRVFFTGPRMTQECTPTATNSFIRRFVGKIEIRNDRHILPWARGLICSFAIVADPQGAVFGIVEPK